MLEINRADFVNALKSLMTMMPKQDVRYFLNSLHMEFNSDNLTMVTTNGHGMMVARLELFMPSELIGRCATIDCTVIENISKAIKAARKGSDEEAAEVVTLSLDGDKWSLSASGMTYQLTEVDGKFPDWQRIANTNPNSFQEVETIGVGTGYLQEIHKAFYHLRGAPYQTVSMQFKGADGAIYIKPGTLHSVKHLKSVELWLMPARV